MSLAPTPLLFPYAQAEEVVMSRSVTSQRARSADGHHRNIDVGPRARARDAGVSLTEILVAVVLLGMTGTAVLSALTSAITGSVVSRNHAAGLVWLQSSSDYVSTTPYIACTPGSEASVAAGYRAQLQSAAAPRSTLSWPQTNLTVVEPVLFWSSGGFGTACNTGAGIQQMTLRATGPAGIQSVTLVVVKSKPSS